MNRTYNSIHKYYIVIITVNSGEQNGYNIPELTPAPEVDYILSEEGAKLLRENPNLPISPQAKRLISDAYICFYQSQEVQMYM